MSLRGLKFISLSPSARRFFTNQLIFIAAAVSVFGIVSVIGWPGRDFIGILVFSLCVGNLTMLGMTRLSPFVSRLPFPYDWLAYLSFLFLVALTSAIGASLLILEVFRIPLTSFWRFFWSAGRLGVLIVFIVGVAKHLYSRTRGRWERRNLELQREMEAEKSVSQLQDQELEKAKEIQKGLLPKKIEQMRNLEIAGAWHPARVVGGDYFDVLKFSESKVGICIGDVVGKGLTAALLMANLQAAVRALVSESLSPAALCKKLNSVICNNVAADKFITFFYGVIDAEERVLSYANAGHWPPVLVRRSGTEVGLKEGGALLGVFPDWKYDDGEIQLEQGDRLVLYTDGLTEATNPVGQEFGKPRLVELLKLNVELSAADLHAKLMKQVLSFCGGNLQDDLALLVVTVK